jgi:hypothetical protein
MRHCNRNRTAIQANRDALALPGRVVRRLKMVAEDLADDLANPGVIAFPHHFRLTPVPVPRAPRPSRPGPSSGDHLPPAHWFGNSAESVVLG